MKRWQKKQVINIDVELFKVDVMIFVAMSEKEIRQRKKMVSKKYEKEFLECIEDWDKDSDAQTQGRMHSLGGGFVVLIKTNESWVKTFGVLIHEMTHVTQYLLKDRRIPLSEDTDEIHAYLVEYLVTTAARKML